jgi:aminopeptidase N
VSPPEPGPGIPLTLATARAAQIRDLRYALAFEIPASASEAVSGHATIRFITTPGTPVVLDFAPGADALTAVSVRGTAVQPRVVDGHVILPGELIAEGENTIEIAFRAGDAALNRNPDFLYTLFVPARAHLTFPCFDQPDMKARYALTLTVPADWQAVANGQETARDVAGDRVRIRYAETAPIPTYLFAFAAGRYQVEQATRSGRTLRMFHRETDLSKVARNRDALFDLHAAALTWLEDYTGIAYPFGKFDFVLIPSFQFSGMEHPGAILYSASSLLLDESATETQMLNRASTISHETAHMWFGDLVTMRWFDDVWMKEVFANFMAGKVVNPSFPAINHDLRFLVANYPAAYSVDRTEGTHAIRQPVRRDHLSEGADRHATARAPDRGVHSTGRPARLPGSLQVWQCDVARPRADPRRPQPARSVGLEPRLG